MASPAHCFFCFETLSASFDRRDSPSLQRVLDLYEIYISATKSAEEEEGEEPREYRVELQPAGSDEEDDHVDQEEEDIERFNRRTTRKTGPQLPSISRLQASTSSSRSSSASASVSTSSSASQLTTPSSAATSISSRPSATYATRLAVTDTYPLFVTWNTVSRLGHKSLRGCIGTFEPLPLSTGLATYALTSAFDDTRFSPIPASLLPALSCSLTLLADFEPCSDALDWILGTHGLRISFNYRGRRHGATYLPDVAVEQGWAKDETVESLMRKAGWDGSYNGGGSGVARRLLRGGARAGNEQQQGATRPWEEVQDFRAVRYTGLKSSATYNEWMEWRNWVEGQGEELK